MPTENHDSESAEKRDETESRDSGENKDSGEDSGGKKREFHVSKKTLIIGGIVLAVLLVAGILYWLHARHFESTDDAYTTARVHEISVRVAGTVEKVAVNDNEPVERGQTLVVLDQRDFKVAVEKARADATQAEAQITQRKAAAEQVRANLEKAQNDYDRVISLAGKDLKGVSRADVDNASAALKAAKGAVDAADADSAAGEAASKAANASLHDADLQLSYAIVTSPVAGVVGKRTVESGARVQPGQALMAVVERDVWVLANFKETQLAQVRVGQHVDVKIDAIPGHVFSAYVDSFQPGTGSAFALLPPDNATGNFTKIVQRVPVKIVFDNFDGLRDRIVPGLSCKPKIDLRTRKDQQP